MRFTVQFREYIFGGLRQRTLYVRGAPVRGTAREQQTGGWTWFLRYDDGQLAAEGMAETWEEVLLGIRAALMQEARGGRVRLRQHKPAS